MTQANISQAPLNYSFELFPPDKVIDEREFWRVVGNLEALAPSFLSVTYGALGNSRAKSLATVKDLQEHSKTQVAAHLTVVDSSKQQTLEILESLWNQGVRHILALTGDSREDSTFTGYKDAVELVGAIKRRFDFKVTVAAYPEVHPLAQSPQADLDVLKAKFDAGADNAITQYFFDAQSFLRFRDRVARAGIDAPIIPGILPIHDFFKIKNFSKKCGASIPENYELHFAGMEGNQLAQHQVALDFAVELCEQLVDEGVNDLHFYTLNRSELVLDIVTQLNAKYSLHNDLSDAA